MFRSQSLTPLLLLLLTACGTLVRDRNWQDARRDSSTQAPDPAITPEAVIQVYAARTVGVHEDDPPLAGVEAAVRDYPYPSSYRTWPGPNSNTFTAFVGRAVPELRLDLPPTAVGKDFLPGGGPVGITPSGTGVQLSLLGLAGVLVGWEEGVELNLLGLTFGLDLNRPALKLPGVGRVGVPDAKHP